MSMKNSKKHIATTIIITCLLLPVTVRSQDPPPPPPPGHGATGNVPGGGAPIGSGLLILMGLGGIYGGYKGYRANNMKRKNLPDL